MNLQDIYTSKAIAAYWNEYAPALPPYLGEAFFPNAQQLGIDLTWYKNVTLSAKPLTISAFDANALVRDRGNIESLKTRMPLYKNIMRIDESTRQQLNLVASSNNAMALETLTKRIFDDATTLIQDAALTREVQRWQLLTTGVYSKTENGNSYTFDYNIPSGHKKTLTTGWATAASATPLADIKSWQRTIEGESGVTPNVMFINSATLDLMAQTDNVKNSLFARYSGITTVPTSAEVVAYLATLGITCYVYDKGYKNGTTFTKFIPDNTVVLAPNTTLGHTMFGTTPEESDFMTGNINDFAKVDTGVAITQHKIFDPVTTEIKVSEVVLPTFELSDQIIIATV